MLTAIETTATIGANRQLLLDDGLPMLDDGLPNNASSKVRVIVLFDEDGFSERDWLNMASRNDV